MIAIKNEIMKRVRRIFLIRRVGTPLAFLVVSTVIIASTVSVSHVLANMPEFGNMEAVIRFYTSAFVHTQFIVKCALVAGIAFLVVTLKGALETVRVSLSFGKM